MDTTTFCQSYIDLAYHLSAIAQKPAKMELEHKRLKQECKHYADFLEKFEMCFDVYPALKQELFDNLSTYKVGAFIEYTLDLFRIELKKVEVLKAEIQKEIAELRKNFTDESKEWLQEEENEIIGCFRYLNTANIQQIISFLSHRLAALNTKKESYLSEKQRLLYDSKASERQAEEERKHLSMEEARRRGIQLSEEEKQERQRKAQEEYNKQMKRRKK